MKNHFGRRSIAVLLVAALCSSTLPADAYWTRPTASVVSSDIRFLFQSQTLFLGETWFVQSLAPSRVAARVRRLVHASPVLRPLVSVAPALAMGAMALLGGMVGLVYIDEEPQYSPRSPAPQTPNLYKNWLEFVGDNSPDWQRFNLLGTTVLKLSEKNGGRFFFDDVKGPALASFADHLLPSDEGKVQHLLGKMIELDMLSRQDDGHFQLRQHPEVIAVKTESASYIQHQLEQALRAESRDGQVAEENLVKLLNLYSTITEQWKLDPLESRWPFLKAVTFLTRADQNRLLDFVAAHEAQLGHWPLMISLPLMLGRPIPENWLPRHAPHLVGRNIYIVGSECWNVAGGLGRVLQYKAAGIVRLSKNHLRVITIEPYYSHWLDGQRKLHEGLQYGPGGPLIIPVLELSSEPVMTYPVRVGDRDVTAEVFKGTNEFGIDVYLIRDRQTNPANGKIESLITRVVYNYRKWDKPATDEAISTEEEFTEFLSAATLEMQRRLEEDEQQKRQREYRAPIISTNDGQLGPYALFKRLLDRTSSVLLGAVVTFVTHTYRNRMWFRGADSSSMGASNADFVQAVAAVHRQEKAAPTDPHVRIVANTNGDHRALTRRNFLKHWEALFGQADHEHPTADQIRQLKARAKKALRFDRQLLESLGIFRNDEHVLDPAQGVVVYDGRLVLEKSGWMRALHEKNIRALVAAGRQVVIYGNIQKDTQWMYDELVRVANDVNGKGPGLLIVRSGWGLPEQVELLAAADVIVVDSDRGTEAAGISETDGMATGCIIVAPSGIEGILQKQGLPINKSVPYSGNTLIPKETTREGYLEALTWLFDLYDTDPERFASYQAASVRISRILEAELPAAESLRQYDRAVQRKENPLYILTEVRQRLTEAEKYLWPTRMRTELIHTMANPVHGRMLTVQHPDVKAAIVKLENNDTVLVGVDSTDTQPSPWGEKKFGRVLFDVASNAPAIQALLGGASLNDSDAEFVVVDAATGERYGQYKLSKILSGDFQIGVPVGKFQMLQFVSVPKSVIKDEAAPAAPPASPRSLAGMLMMPLSLFSANVGVGRWVLTAAVSLLGWIIHRAITDRAGLRRDLERVLRAA